MSSSRKSTPTPKIKKENTMHNEGTNINNSIREKNLQNSSNNIKKEEIENSTSLPASSSSSVPIAFKNSNKHQKILPDNYYSLKSCNHLNQVLKSKASKTVFDTYKQAVKISQPIINSNTYKLKQNNSIIDQYKLKLKKNQSLKCSDCSITNFQQNMICLQCPHIGCDLHSFNHYKATQHMFAIDSKYGLLYCFKCNNYINHPKLERIRSKVVINNYNGDEDDDDSNDNDNDKDNDNDNEVNDNENNEFQNENYTNPNKLSILGLKGFVNLGATCFMSSILQTFIHNPLIKNQFFNNDLHYFNCNHLKNQEIHGIINEKNACITCSIDSIFKKFFTTTNNEGFGMTNLLTTSWYKQKSLAGFQEQDAHEFWQFLLNEFHQDYQRVMVTQKQVTQNGEVNGSSSSDSNGSTNGATNSNGHTDDINDSMDIDHEHNTSRSRNGSIINLDSKGCKCITHSTFSFELQSCVKCNSCKSITETVDPMIDISLEINHLNQSQPESKINLYDCLNLFTQEEKLDSMIKCKICQNKSKATKTLKLKNLSPILSIQLKRFNHNILNDISSKIETPVEIPLYLDLSRYLSEEDSNKENQKGEQQQQTQQSNQFFELFSIVCHIGSVNTGHYIVYIKNFQNLWFKFDDSVISIVDQIDVINSNAYLLYYIVHNI
ncbi:uncharacterized protein KGF55_004833 [Candida pseudojiufengensis]|uniref:uncharacterized protein n=1 Tax=Candida pseudojiufengensis TaxID=497109 RepID=UPI0022255D14|nr:uncharacterized protein KGF55_004833 [Candida pseudojiufengensis]KAI5960110.1 hypothetical protein KGF55_004833 [Candida pseudojiufengensis]